MPNVRVVWGGDAGFMKRSSAAGLVAGTELPEPTSRPLSKRGVDLARGRYRLKWVFTGEAGQKVSLTVEQQSGDGWTEVAQTGPHRIASGKDRVDSERVRPPKYMPVHFVVR